MGPSVHLFTTGTCIAKLLMFKLAGSDPTQELVSVSAKLEPPFAGGRGKEGRRGTGQVGATAGQGRVVETAGSCGTAG